MKTLKDRVTKPLAVGLMLLLGFVLTGCMAVNIDMEIDKDLKISGTWQYTFDRQMLEDQSSQYGSYGTPTDYEGDVDKSVQEAQAEAPAGVTVEKVSTDTDLGMKLTLDKVDPNGLTDASETGLEGMSISEENGEISFSMPNFIRSSDLGTGGVADYQTGGGDPADMFTEATVKLTFPGKIIDAPGGQIEDNVVTYNLKSFDGDTITVKAKSSSFPWWILFVIGGILLLLLIGGGILLAVLLSRKKKQQQHQGGPAVAASYGVPGQYGQSGQYGQPSAGPSAPGQYGHPGPQSQPGPQGQPPQQGQPGGPGRVQPPQAPGSAPGPYGQQGGSQPQWGHGQSGQQYGQPGQQYGQPGQHYGQPPQQGPGHPGYGNPGYGSGPQPPRQ